MKQIFNSNIFIRQIISKEACNLFSSVHATHDCYLHNPKFLDLTVLSKNEPVPPMVDNLENLAEGLIGSFLTQRASLSQQA